MTRYGQPILTAWNCSVYSQYHDAACNRFCSEYSAEPWPLRSANPGWFSTGFCAGYLFKLFVASPTERRVLPWFSWNSKCFSHPNYGQQHLRAHKVTVRGEKRVVDVATAIGHPRLNCIVLQCLSQQLLVMFKLQVVIFLTFSSCCRSLLCNRSYTQKWMLWTDKLRYCWLANVFTDTR